MTNIVGPPRGAIRNQPIAADLTRVLEAAAQAAGIDTVRITSGGQDAKGQGTRRTGSTRHDHGRAADLQLVVDGITQSFTDQSAPSTVLSFITAAATAGATGIGAGVQYMGNKTIHVGFGTSAGDTSKLVWGAGGRSVNAPRWLSSAANAGWAAPPVVIGASGARPTGSYLVAARSGLKLRGGPGPDFESERTIPAGTLLNVIKFDSQDPSWAGVDLEGDGMVDGYVFASFLTPANEAIDVESVPEPEDIDEHVPPPMAAAAFQNGGRYAPGR